MFKIDGTRLVSDSIAFNLPQGFNLIFRSEVDGNGISFLSDDGKVGIDIFFTQETCIPQEHILQFCKEKIFVALSGIFKVKRGQGEAYALFYNDVDTGDKFYSECYPFTDKKLFFNRVYIELCVDEKGDDKFVAKSALLLPEVKAFFDSIEYL
ncbi:MAG: hypothetical protein HDQ88_02395 [Clostridia bacterium]|nr:hypothetical protein [Clostridia bacterium]